jgi:hypothetical protein
LVTFAQKSFCAAGALNQEGPNPGWIRAFFLLLIMSKAQMGFILCKLSEGADGTKGRWTLVMGDPYSEEQVNILATQKNAPIQAAVHDMISNDVRERDEMSKLTLLCLFLMMSTLVSASEPMTVQQLEQLVSQLQGKPDKDISQRLAAIKLTERLSTERLKRLEDTLPGERSRQTLLAVADVSGFLELPSADLPSVSAPAVSVQKQILSRAVDFVAATTARMPNFLAQRRILRFEDTKFGLNDNDPIITTPDTYHLVDDQMVNIRYENGRGEEQSSLKDHKQDETNAPKMGLTTWGVFGPMLQTVMHDILVGSAVWSHWEQSSSGLVAVFRYSVPKERATFTMKWCCARKGPGIFEELQTVPKYHGELSVNPDSGVVTRMTLIADPDAAQPISSAKLFVEYGPVEIAGKTYTVPTRSATLLTAKSPVARGAYVRGGMTMYSASEENLNVTAISDSRFEQYHVFRSEVRIVGQ